MRYRGRALSAVVLLLFAVWPLVRPYPAIAAETPYNPEVCKRDAHGKLYVALGRNVLGLPITHPVVARSDLYGNNERIPPPDPSDEEGCPDNPLQVQAYGFPYVAPNALLAGEGSNPTQIAGAKEIKLYRISVIDTAGKWGDEHAEKGLVPLICKDATLHQALPTGLTACLIKPEVGREVDERDWGGVYYSRHDVYGTPSGDFIVACDPVLFSGFIGSCRVRYAVSPGLGLAYDFQPYDRTERYPHKIVPISKIIDFDKDLREAIARARIPEYPWP